MDKNDAYISFLFSLLSFPSLSPLFFSLLFLFLSPLFPEQVLAR
jgi:hypothetical protein